MMKVVFDTNVYVADALGGDTARRIVASTARARWRVFVSQHILDELLVVLTEDLRTSRRDAAWAVERCLRGASLIAPAVSRHIVRADDKDSPVLRTALRAGTDYLVTNDQHLLALNPYEGIRIVSMAAYRMMLEENGLFL